MKKDDRFWSGFWLGVYFGVLGGVVFIALMDGLIVFLSGW